MVLTWLERNSQGLQINITNTSNALEVKAWQLTMMLSLQMAAYTDGLSCFNFTAPFERLHCDAMVRYVNRTAGWSKSPSWRGHGWPPAARQAASEGLRLPSAPVRRGPEPQMPPGGRGLRARGRPS